VSASYAEDRQGALRVKVTAGADTREHLIPKLR
jgi:hypothetical protein